MILLYVLIGVYFAAANVYAFFLVRAEKRRERARGEKTGGNGRLLLAGLLGGEVTAYAAMFAMKFRTDDPLPMIALPLLAAVNILLAVALIRGTAVAFA